MANATVLTEAYSFDDLNDIEFSVSDIDSSLVMSLLEDSQVLEGTDDERLRSVIQSLEAEIINQDSFLQEINSEDYQFSDVEHIESCSTSPDCIYFEGFDLEMMPYVISHFADEIENEFEFVGVSDYSEICCGIAMEEEEDDYHGLWQ